MGMRDKFAESALVGLLAEFLSGSVSTVVDITGCRCENSKDVADQFAKAAYALADAMIRAREVRP